jgi:tetratricopeptide (TPR) repeat protein
MAKPRPARLVLAAVVLSLLVLAAFGRTAGNDFITFDDLAFIHENPPVRAGLTLEGVRWAFLESWGFQGNAIPLAWLSHMVDVSLFGLDPAGHHLTGVALHLGAALLLLGAVRVMTGSLPVAFLAAAIFAVHPLRAESVAWVAERKDVLSALLGFAFLLTWARYAARPSLLRYAAAFLLLVLGLLAKPMLVTLPFLLLLLDWWPLGRLGRGGRDLLPLLVEKIPLAAVAAGFTLAAYLAQAKGGAVVALARIPFRFRLGNALVSLAAYLRKAVWPSDLAVFYPHPGAALPGAAVAAAFLFLAAVTLWAVVRRGTKPWLLTGWGWYLGLLLPVLGLVQIGHQAMADRYTYLPLTGIALAGVREAGALVRGRAARGAATLLAAAILLLLTILTFREVGFWRDAATLFGRAVAVTGENWLAEYHLGNALTRQGRPDEAREHYRRSLALRGVATEEDPAPPDRTETGAPGAHSGPAWYVQMGDLHAAKGNLDEAADHYRTALNSSPADHDARARLGMALVRLGRPADALPHLEEAARLRPDSADDAINLAYALERLGRKDEAVGRYREALRLRPGDRAAARRLTELTPP